MLSCFLPMGLCGLAVAQPLSPQELVKQVVHNELEANKNDHSHWMYRDSDKLTAKSTVKLVVETGEATISKTIELDGRPLTPQEQAEDQAKMEAVVNDPSVRAKQRKKSAHDDEQGIALTKMVANAFLWTEAGVSNGEITLHFKPNPAFQPPTYDSRVFAAMAGTMVVDAKQKRLKDLSGTLIRPVEFGWGLLGKLEKGGTFRVVRSQVAPGEWEITETHVHISGHAFIIRSINEQEDEITSNYKRTSASMTLREALDKLNSGEIAKELGLKP
ncbi:MAG: hypothetical protein ACYCOR_00530 [Acidobacteriaceae bacterium]